MHMVPPFENTIELSGWGLIAGNGRFPFLVLEGARSQGIEMAVIALREEASADLEKAARRLHWVSLGELSKAIDLLHQEGVTQAVMAGQVKHSKIFSSIRPDWRLAKLLFSLPKKNTDALIGAVARVLEEEGIHLVDSTAFLKPLVPEPGVLTRRAPNEREAADIADGVGAARHLAATDIGQTVVIAERACVAVVGAGEFGRNHARGYRELEGADLAGLVDGDAERAAQVAAEFGADVIPDIEALRGRVDAASLAVPTAEHAAVGIRLLEMGIDVLVEKPMASSLEEADALIQAARRHGRILQVGHVERFNPAVLAVEPSVNRPLFFEVHRLGVFSQRSLDVDVIYDVMIH